MAEIRPGIRAGHQAVGLPSAIAYPALAGLPPEVGIYASIMSVLGYALLGSSRQLIMGPDAGTVMVLAAVLASFGLSSIVDNVTASAAIAVIVGLLCFLASIFALVAQHVWNQATSCAEP